MTLYEKFVEAVKTADRNATIIFLATLVALLAWASIDWMPLKIQPYARGIAWAWAIIFLVGTIIYSL